MNYNMFTKAEITEAIKYSNTKCYNYIDGYLLEVWSKKIKKLLNEIDTAEKEICRAIENNDVEKFLKWTVKEEKLNKKYKKLTKIN